MFGLTEVETPKAHLRAIAQMKHPPDTRWTYLDPSVVSSTVDAFPFCCDGRLMVSKDLAPVIKKRERDLQIRVVSAYKAKHTPKAQHTISRNIQDSPRRTPAKRRELISSISQVEETRGAEARARKAAITENFSVSTEQNIIARLGAKARRLQDEKDRGETEMVQSLLIAMAMGSAAQHMHGVIQRWHSSAKERLKRVSACMILARHYMHYRSRKFAAARRQALWTLSLLMRDKVKHWREKRVNKKADMVRTYLREVGNFARLQLHVKQFRARICRMQSIIRAKLKCHHSRCYLLGLQWDKAEKQRHAHFNRLRETALDRIQESQKKGLEMRGRQKTFQEQKLRNIEYVGGRKKRSECELSLEASRTAFCERFLPPELQRLSPIQPSVRRKMIDFHVRKLRAQYQRSWAIFKRQLKAWREHAQTTDAVKAALTPSSEHLPPARKVPEPLYRVLTLLGDRKPLLPRTCLFLPPEAMKQAIEKAVEFSARISQPDAEEERAGAKSSAGRVASGAVNASEESAAVKHTASQS